MELLDSAHALSALQAVYSKPASRNQAVKYSTPAANSG